MKSGNSDKRGEANPIFLVVGDTVRNPGRSGIQTVVRCLAAALGDMRAPVRPVCWNARHEHLHPLPPERALGLAAESLRDPPGAPLSLWWQPVCWPAWWLTGRRTERIPLQFHPRHRHAPKGSWVLIPELMYGAERADQFVRYVHRRGWRVALIFHDAIPVQRPEYVPPTLPARHADYMRAFSHADLILPNSEASAEGWREFMAKEGLKSPPVRTITLACDIPGAPRVSADAAAARQRPKAAGEPVRMLCVSTLEPRKNHKSLLEAFELAVARRPDLPMELDLVGSPYVDAQDIADRARAAIKRLPGRVRWHEKVEHGRLRQFYEEADFTVYPSVLEGFGLPVIESLWFGCPCVCANFSVMAENAADGGCLTVDVRDPDALAGAIIKMVESPDLRRRLAVEGAARKLKTWRDYAEEVLAALANEN
jgi:glycosyltransferase involved in cell wall biosynthesis